MGSYDAVIDHLAGRPPDPAVRDALRLGAHQLLAMRVPDHAAVTSTVELVRDRVGHKPAGFTNARDAPDRASATSTTWMDLLDAPLAVRHSHPQWIVDELARALDRPDELEALLAADNERPLVTLVARPGLSTRRGARSGSTGSTSGRSRRWACTLDVRRPRRGPGGPRGAGGRAGRRLPAGRAGAAPRAGSRAATSAGSTCAPDRAARRPCSPPWPSSAAPGCWPTSASRTGPGWSPRRCGRPAATWSSATGPGPPWPPGSFDRVLVDAPCSGLGALRRRPGEPLAATGAGPRGPGAAAAGAARQRPRLGAARGEWCSTRPARRWSPRRPAWSRPCWPRGPTSARGRGAARPRGRGRRRPRTSPGPSSSGRTGTAPTRCSWRCCGAADGTGL